MSPVVAPWGHDTDLGRRPPQSRSGPFSASVIAQLHFDGNGADDHHRVVVIDDALYALDEELPLVVKHRAVCCARATSQRLLIQEPGLPGDAIFSQCGLDHILVVEGQTIFVFLTQPHKPVRGGRDGYKSNACKH